MKKSHFDYFEPIRVRYSEIDAQGIVFNAHYLTYFDVALNEYLRHIEFDYHEMVAQEKVDFKLIKSETEYLGPVKFDEVIQVGVTAAKIGNSSLTWQLAIYREGEDEPSTKGVIVWVCVPVDGEGSHPLPKSLVNRLQAAKH